MSTETAELTLATPDEHKAIDTMKRADTASIFKAFEDEANPILEHAKALTVTDAGQVAVIDPGCFGIHQGEPGTVDRH